MTHSSCFIAILHYFNAEKVPKAWRMFTHPRDSADGVIRSAASWVVSLYKLNRIQILIERRKCYYCWRVWLVLHQYCVEGLIIGTNYRYVFISAVMTRVPKRAAEEENWKVRWDGMRRLGVFNRLRKWILYHGAGQLSMAVHLRPHIRVLTLLILLRWTISISRTCGNGCCLDLAESTRCSLPLRSRFGCDSGTRGVSATPDVALTKNREDIDILLSIKNLLILFLPRRGQWNNTVNRCTYHLTLCKGQRKWSNPRPRSNWVQCRRERSGACSIH